MVGAIGEEPFVEYELFLHKPFQFNKDNKSYFNNSMAVPGPVATTHCCDPTSHSASERAGYRARPVQQVRLAAKTSSAGSHIHLKSHHNSHCEDNGYWIKVL